jgi:hypothetical protein
MVKMFLCVVGLITAILKICSVFVLSLTDYFFFQSRIQLSKPETNGVVISKLPVPAVKTFNYILFVFLPQTHIFLSVSNRDKTNSYVGLQCQNKV